MWCSDCGMADPVLWQRYDSMGNVTEEGTYCCNAPATRDEPETEEDE